MLQLISYLVVCDVGSQAALSKLKEDLRHDPKLASQYGVVIKSKQTSSFSLICNHLSQ